MREINLDPKVILNKLSKYGLFIAAGFLLFTAAMGSYQIVNPGQRGIMVTLGKPSTVALSEGLHFKMPFISEIRLISVRIQKSEAKSEAATKDMQRVGAVLALNWSLDPSKVSEVYVTIGNENDIAERIIKPAVSEVLKASTSKMTAEEVLTKRLELKTHIDELLVARLARYNVIVKDISLVDLDFTAEFNHAVEEKQIAEQKAKRAEYVAQQAKQDAVARVNAAKGEAESNLALARAQAESNLTLARSQAEGQKLLKQSITADVLQLEYLKKWNGVLPTVMSGKGSGMILNLPASATTPSAATVEPGNNEDEE